MNDPSSRKLSPDERRWLLRLARSTIEAELGGRRIGFDAPSSGPLAEARGAFVTLTDRGALRGCIGHVVGTEALWRSVRTNAVNAAFRDPRFPPVEAAEVAGLTIEISALSPLREIGSADEVVVGRDGLVLERGSTRGLLLPQVAERYGWSAEQFLDETCRKAGMAAGCWRDPSTTIRSFSAEVFSETDSD